MNSIVSSTSFSTTKQEPIRVRQCGPQRNIHIFLKNASVYPLTRVFIQDYKLIAGDCEIIFRGLSWLRHDIPKGVLNEASLLTHVHELGRQFPGAHLYDCLLSSQNHELVPFFPPDVTLVFLGSTALYMKDVPGEKMGESQKELVLPEDTNPVTRLKNWIMRKKPEAPVSVRPQTPAAQPEVCFLALQRDSDGEVYPWFIPLQDLINKIEEDNQEILVVVARPLK